MSGNRFWPRKGARRHLRPDPSEYRRIYRNKWKRHTARIPKELLTREYGCGKSMQDIANLIGCSLHKVKFWMERYEISRRSHSDAVYLSKHPNGDPFRFVPPKNVEEAKLFGLGIGLYWGEGTKANHTSIRLGNTDPLLIKKFIEFLVKFFRVKREDMRFGLQVFSDMDPDTAMDFWVKNLKIKRGQFWKATVTRSGSIGTYRKKSQYGVVTVHYQNSRLRKLLGSLLPV